MPFGSMWNVLWPRHLIRQVLVVTAAVILSSGVLYSLIAERRTADLARLALERQVAAFAHSVASAVASHLILGDADALEEFLLNGAGYPGVTAIVVADAQGKVVAAVEVQPEGTPRANFDRARIEIPTDGSSPRIVRVGDDDLIEVHAPIRNGAVFGWVRARMSTASERAMAMNARSDALVWAGAISMVTLGVLYLFFGRALQPVKACARFASRLGSRLGSTLTLRAGSIEIEKLVEALNFASRELRDKVEALAASKADARAVLDTVADAIIGFDTGGSITFVNPAGCSIFGVDPAAVVGRPMTSLLPEVTCERIGQLMREGVMVGGAGGRTMRLETNGLRNGGVYFPAQVALGVIASGGGAHLTCIARDLTEEKLANDRLRLFNQALECSANGVVIVDLAFASMPIIYANAAFERITGYSAAEVIGRNCKFLQKEDCDQPAIDTLRQAVREGTAASVTLRNYRKDGLPFWNELSIAPVRSAEGTITHFIGVQTDVTMARHAARALAEHSARHDAVFAMSPDGFVLFERPGRLAEVNPAFVAMTGLAATELQGCSLDAFDALLRGRCDPQLPYVPSGGFDAGSDKAAANEAGDVVYLMQPERRVLQRHVRVTAGGHELILFFRDVTRETEVDRMKSEFLSTAAHELRTPMVSIFGFSELLLKRKYPETRQREYLETIYRQTGQLVNLVNELLDLARIEARQGKDFKIEAQPLEPIVATTVAALYVPGDSRKVELAVLPELPLVQVDAEKLRQALTNVLGNAYKYSPNGGAIRLRTLVGSDRARQQVGIVVEDEGIGMTPEQLARAFERFFRADASGNIPGTGLGLCLVKEIIELQGGRVEMASEHGRGTTVTLWLPAEEVGGRIAA